MFSIFWRDDHGQVCLRVHRCTPYHLRTMNRTPLVLIFALATTCRRDPAPRSPLPPPAIPRAMATEATLRPGAPPAASVDPPTAAESFRETGRFFPQNGELRGWPQSGAVRLVNGRELFQVIDGAGEKYLGYGFRQLARTDYRKAGTQLVVTAEVYDMGTTLGAFGQYSMLLSDSRDTASMQSQSVSHGGGGFLGTSQLVFWKGQFLVQLNLADDSGEQDEAALATTAREVLPTLATRLAGSIPGETVLPTGARVLPTDGLVWGGATYLANGVFGIDQTGPGWVGHYAGTEGRRCRVAILTRSSADEARTLLRRFRVGEAAPLPGVAEEAFSTPSLSAARKGVTVVVVGPPSPESLPALRATERNDRLSAIIGALP